MSASRQGCILTGCKRVNIWGLLKTLNVILNLFQDLLFQHLLVFQEIAGHARNDGSVTKGVFRSPLINIKKGKANFNRQSVAGGFADDDQRYDGTIPASVLTRQHAAKMLNVSLPTLHFWTKEGIVKGTRIGSCVH